MALILMVLLKGYTKLGNSGRICFIEHEDKIVEIAKKLVGEDYIKNETMINGYRPL